jgi:exodeoxyribonuclease VII small subunit
VATKTKAPADDSTTPPPTFEAAMDRLEAIVESMEAGDVPLAELLAKFEEGSRLLATCEERLKAAELKIEQLKRRKDGTPALENFPASTSDSAADGAF